MVMGNKNIIETPLIPHRYHRVQGVHVGLFGVEQLYDNMSSRILYEITVISNQSHIL